MTYREIYNAYVSSQREVSSPLIMSYSEWLEERLTNAEYGLDEYIRENSDPKPIVMNSTPEAIEELKRILDGEGLIIKPRLIHIRMFEQAIINRELLKHISPAKKYNPVPINDCIVRTWFERDRAYVALRLKMNENIDIVEFWDEAYAEAVEDGFINPRKLLESLYEYANERKLLPERNEDAASDEDE